MNKEICIVVGYNAAGKSTLVKEYESQGYYRINRDESGGTISQQTDLARKALSNHDRIILDNTYPTAAQRAEVIALGKECKIPVRCIHLNTSFEDAQLNACLRMLDRIGKLADTRELNAIKDPNLFPPVALFVYKKTFEKPTLSEGFSKVEVIKFERKYQPGWNQKAVILDYDDTLRRSLGAHPWPEHVDDVEILPNRKEVLRKYVDDGYLLLGASNQSAISKGLDQSVAIACFEQTNKLLGFDIPYQFCPHNVPPVICYCRKPHCGIGAYFIWKYKLDPRQCLMVGDQTSDKTFAGRCGFTYIDQSEFFKV